VSKVQQHVVCRCPIVLTEPNRQKFYLTQYAVGNVLSFASAAERIVSFASSHWDLTIFVESILKLIWSVGVCFLLKLLGSLSARFWASLGGMIQRMIQRRIERRLVAAQNLLDLHFPPPPTPPPPLDLVVPQAPAPAHALMMLEEDGQPTPLVVGDNVVVVHVDNPPGAMNNNHVGWEGSVDAKNGAWVLVRFPASGAWAGGTVNLRSIQLIHQ